MAWSPPKGLQQSVTHGTTTLAETEEATLIDAPSVVGQGICQIRIDPTPADALVRVTMEEGGRYRIERKSHHGTAIEIRYRISYGLGRALRSEV